MSVIIEIRAAEGGEDAKLLVAEQYNIYKKFAQRKNIEIDILDSRSGMIVFKATGRGSKDFL